MRQIVLPFPSAADVGAAPRRRSLRPEGKAHDLAAMLEDLNRRFFEGGISARITWGRGRTASRRRRRRRHITLGSYCRRTKLITIHPHLDRECVPPFFVEAIVFHEMCHEIAGVERAGGMRRVHTPRFRELERRYPMYAEAKRWAKENIGLLLANATPG